jgi:cysteine desulfurase/selenocysteine lyase
VSGAVGLAAAVQYLQQNRDAIVRHEAHLTQYALDQLSQVTGLRLLGPLSATQRVPVFSFVLAGHSPDQVLRHLDARGVAIRAGELAALPLLKRFGVTAAARASCYLYTETKELDRLGDALREITGYRKEDWK